MRLVIWSIFKAVPTITSLGITALNGVTVAYVRQELGHHGYLFLYSNRTTEMPIYYKEVVDEVTGASIAPPTVECLLPLHTYQWFMDAMKVPLNNRSWLIERKTPSKFLDRS
jgi:hypothetical protein